MAAKLSFKIELNSGKLKTFEFDRIFAIY